MGMINKSFDMEDKKWLEAALIWINNMASPNEGMTHPLDEDKLKSVANLLASLNVDIDESIIIKKAQSLGIIDDSIQIIVKAFKQAKSHKYIIMNRFPEDFLKLRLIEIAKENGL